MIEVILIASGTTLAALIMLVASAVLGFRAGFRASLKVVDEAARPRAVAPDPHPVDDDGWCACAECEANFAALAEAVLRHPAGKRAPLDKTSTDVSTP